MGVTLKKQRDGSYRKQWYGDYLLDGKRKVIALNLRWKGIPPASGSLRHAGDDTFEASRKNAMEALAKRIDNERHKGRAEHLIESLIESKTGQPVKYTRLADLAERWRKQGREMPVSENYLKGCDAVFNRFVAFMRERNAEAVFLYEVTADDTAEYIRTLQATFSRKTVRDAIKMLNKAFARCLPVGTINPFAALVGRRSSGEKDMIHREPFSLVELENLLRAAQHDELMHSLITAAACTGLRRGDVCNLRWSAVDWEDDMLVVKTSKTAAEVEIPIFAPLRAVLEKRRNNGSEYVFPEAARLLAESPDHLTWRFKKLVVAAFDKPKPTALPEHVPAGDMLAEGEAAIRKQVPEGPRRERMLKILRLYCAGTSFRQITASTRIAKSTISGDLHAIQAMTGKNFLRRQTPSIKTAVQRLTRVERKHGQRAASIRDWHALRATWVTLALITDTPTEMVRRVTGHSRMETVRKHYFRPNREQFRDTLTNSMPSVLTGVGSQPLKLKPCDELVVLAGKVAAGTASEKEKARLRVLAVKV